MKIQYLFYTLGIIFLFATVAYFSYNFLFSLPDTIKTILLFLVVIVFFFLGEILWERDL